MTRLQQLGRKILMAGDAGVCTDVEVAEVAHAGGDPGIVIPIRSRVPTQPAASGAMTGFAGNAFVRTRGGGEPARCDRLQRRMTNRATRARLRPGDSEAFSHPLRPRIEQNGKRLGVKILPTPGDILAPLRTSATVTTG